MFGLFKKARPPSLAVRDTLFGDLPLEDWGADHSATSPAPWSLFARSRDCLRDGRTDEAIAIWREIVGTPALESRHYLQAWSFLRRHGVPPPPDLARRVMGVVVEVGMPRGLDLLAAFEDHSARYYNFSGSAVVWEHPDARFDRDIDELLTAAVNVVSKIGPWDKPRLGPPQAGVARLNFLTPSGLYFGQGPLQALQQDAVAAPVVGAALHVLEALTQLAAMP